jgi:hypothetical protein
MLDSKFPRPVCSFRDLCSKVFKKLQVLNYNGTYDKNEEQAYQWLLEMKYPFSVLFSLASPNCLVPSTQCLGPEISKISDARNSSQ